MPCTVLTITDCACTDALTPELFLAWNPQLLGCCPSRYDDAMRLHLHNRIMLMMPSLDASELINMLIACIVIACKTSTCIAVLDFCNTVA